MHFIVMGYDKASFTGDKCVWYIEGCATVVAVAMEVWGRNIIKRA